ncbi:hypothetical protein GPJ56_003907 [Histomonas meleagridis]|uniref:uncharacterized protein n=1 Tax=Histomonas meleagridis TaxID=135588 RepID=UPI00355A27AD|nr:hypothetical protein GPJ56_003907 [Histomonas meleagridis]KAH0797550.1 hypothetical protein GO595_009653 [Histomonas meleagridis]
MDVAYKRKPNKIRYDSRKKKFITSVDEEIEKKEYVFGQEIPDPIIGAFLAKCDFFIECFKRNSPNEPNLIKSIIDISNEANLSTNDSISELFISKEIPQALTEILASMNNASDDDVIEKSFKIFTYDKLFLTVLKSIQQFTYYSYQISELFVQLNLPTLLCELLPEFPEDLHESAINILGNLISTKSIASCSLDQIIDVAFNEIDHSDDGIRESSGSWLLSRIAYRTDILTPSLKMTLVSSFSELISRQIASTYSDILGGFYVLIRGTPSLCKLNLPFNVLDVALFGFHETTETSLYHSLLIISVLYQALARGEGPIEEFHEKLSLKNLVRYIKDPDPKISRASIHVVNSIATNCPHLVPSLLENDVFNTMSRVFVSAPFDDKLLILLSMTESCIHCDEGVVEFLVGSGFFIPHILDFMCTVDEQIVFEFMKSLYRCLTCEVTSEQTKEQLSDVDLLNGIEVTGEEAASLLEEIRNMLTIEEQ